MFNIVVGVMINFRERGIKEDEGLDGDGLHEQCRWPYAILELFLVHIEKDVYQNNKFDTSTSKVRFKIIT